MKRYVTDNQCRCLPLVWGVLLMLCAAPACADELKLREVESRFYTIRTNLPVDEVHPFQQHMDRVFAAYQDRFSNFRERREDDMPLVLLRTQEQYVQFMQARGIDAENTGGMFYRVKDDSGLVTWTEDRPRSKTYEALQHEGFHQFAYDYIGAELPIWINEGLAQYFQDGVVLHNTMETGLADARRIAFVRHALNNDNAIPFEVLITSTDDEWAEALRTNHKRAAQLYAQSWSVVFFLIHGDDGRYRSAFTQYLTLISQGRNSEQAMRAAFGSDDLTPMRDKWRTFALEHEPDPLNVALTRLRFLGEALSHMKERDEPMPDTLAQLREHLQKRGFRLTYSSHGISTTYDAKHEALYHFTRTNGSEGTFELLDAARDDLPPRIVARGLDPQPMLVWSRNEAGKLVQDVRFR